MRRPTRASATALAEHLGLSRTYLDRLVASGVITRDDDGKFDVDACRLKYIRSLRQARRSSPVTEAQAQLQRAKARRIELENGRLEGRLMEVQDCIAGVDEIVGVMLVHLSSLPARCTRDMPTRRAIETAIAQMRQEIADTAAKKAREHKGGCVDSRTLEE